MLCPLDSRYKDKVNEIAAIFSPVELTTQRLYVMEFWVKFITTELGIDYDFTQFNNDNDMVDVHAEIEQLEFNVTRHDINACIKYLEKKYNNDPKIVPYIHFGLTSNDVNSVAYANLMSNGISCIKNRIHDVITIITDFANNNNYPMLARTHGQTATPITFKQAMLVFVERLQNELQKLTNIQIHCKFGGATGGMNSLYVVRPDINWQERLDHFIEILFSLQRDKYTTQIDHYDCYAEVFDCLKRISVILINFVQDIWLYISLGYIVQKPVKGEVGSSTMPHKVNPIQMENAKGNLLLAKSLFSTLSAELPISTLQRDLHDSTMLRNIGMPFGYLSLALTSITDGLVRYHPSQDNMAADLDQHWEVLGEAVQTVMRSEGCVNAYDIIKEATRNNDKMDKKSYMRMVNDLHQAGKLSVDGWGKLIQLTPETYLPGF